MPTTRLFNTIAAVCLSLITGLAPAQTAPRETRPDLRGDVAVFAATLYTAAGAPIDNAVVVIQNGKITAVGPAATTAVPEGVARLRAAVVTPGLVDARGTFGLSGIYNVNDDQDQLERSAPIQPELRAIDAYNARDPLVAYVRGFGVTTGHVGHGPGELVSGSTMIVKTRGDTVEQASLVDDFAVAATLDPIAQKSGGASPGTRAKMVAMLRQELIKAREMVAKRDAASSDPSGDAALPDRNLRLEKLAFVLAGDRPLIVTANRAQDIRSALRLSEEFGFPLILDMAAESYVLTDDIKSAAVPVLLHPTMYRAVGNAENLSLTTAATLADAGVLFAIQSGYEPYVPKTRVVLFEAGVAAAHGLGFDRALASVTIDAARILGIESRVGSVEVGKDGDLALYDGDPFEYTTHCTNTIIDGIVYPGEAQSVPELP